MARTKHRRSRARRARISRNPPAMTAARRAKIGAKIRALHRAGKYRKASRSAPRRVSRRRVRTTSMVVRRSSSPARRSSRRRHVARRSSGSRSFGSFGSPMASLKSVISKDILVIGAGAASAGLVTSFVIRQWGMHLPGISNTYGAIAYRMAIPALGAWAVGRWNRKFAEGMLIGGAVMAINSLINQFAPSLTGAAPATAAQIAATGAYPVSPASPIRNFGEYLDPVGAAPNVFQSESAFSQDAFS